MVHFQFYSNPFRANSTLRAVKPFAPPLLLTQMANPSGCSSNFSSVSSNAQGQCVGLSTQDRVPGHRYLSQVAFHPHLISPPCSTALRSSGGREKGVGRHRHRSSAGTSHCCWGRFSPAAVNVVRRRCRETSVQRTGRTGPPPEKGRGAGRTRGAL